MSHIGTSNNIYRANGLLMIGGTSRNVGKTTLISNIIKHFAKSHQIIGLKVKTLYADDRFYHGNENFTLSDDFRLIEEFGSENGKDSSEMLKAGAIRAFRLRVQHTYLQMAYNHFIQQINGNYMIVCESNSLRKVVIPDLFMIIKHKVNQNMKPSAVELEKLANKIITTDGFKHDFNPTDLDIKGSNWILKNQTYL